MGQERIRLQREWKLGAQIGQGGFGQVFEAIADDGDVGVIKLIPKAPGARRELLVVEGLDQMPNVVPVWESGEIETGYALAMPRAELSLREAMQRELPFPLAAALQVIENIVEALAALDGRVVHRDIKPENVLYLNSKWCLADFGIARYAEASTAPDTHKYESSPPYAAPERWSGGRASAATDMYSVGVLAFELLAGVRPFVGPSTPEYRDQHLTMTAPPLPGVPATLASLVAECLWKHPGARPTAANVLQRIRSIAQPSNTSVAKLQQANAIATQIAGQAMASAEAAKLRSAMRKDLFEAAQVSFAALRSELAQRVIDEAPQAGKDFPFVLNAAHLDFDGPVAANEGAFAGRGYDSFEVIAYGSIQVVSSDVRTYQGRAHSLWYCDAVDEGVFRWYEMAWMFNALSRSRSNIYPMAMAPSGETFGALGSGITGYQLAWRFTPVDQGDGQDFIERWLGWFGSAAMNELTHPRQMPEHQTQGSYRAFKRLPA